MIEIFLEKLFEHNNWANQKIIEACSALTDEQLDAEPQSVTKGNIRDTLSHMVASQHGYLSLLTLPVKERVRINPTAADWEDSAKGSGKDLLALAKGERSPLENPLQTTDGYHVDPWVVMLQVINHATEHREQLKSMLTALGITPPSIDGWDFGEVENVLIPLSRS
jgi:uncharacterized damage-inducible protein DinB